MNPLVGRIAGKEREDLRQGHPLLLVRGLLPGDERLLHTTFPHELPHIVVRGSLRLPKVRKAPILRQRLHVAVVVGIQNGKPPHLSINRLRRFGGQKVVFIKKGHGRNVRERMKGKKKKGEQKTRAREAKATTGPPGPPGGRERRSPSPGSCPGAGTGPRDWHGPEPGAVPCPPGRAPSCAPWACH